MSAYKIAIVGAGPAGYFTSQAFQNAQTIEPGFYIQPDDTLFPEEYRGIGVRIEDDILVTESGCKILSNALPRHPDEVEAYMAKLIK